MYLYVKGMYAQWCQGQDEATVVRRQNEFVRLAANTFAYTEDYMCQYLKKTDWFKY